MGAYRRAEASPDVIAYNYAGDLRRRAAGASGWFWWLDEKHYHAQ